MASCLNVSGPQCKVLHWLCFQTHMYFCFPCHILLLEQERRGVPTHTPLQSLTQLMNKAGNLVMTEAERRGTECRGDAATASVCWKAKAQLVQW